MLSSTFRCSRGGLLTALTQTLYPTFQGTKLMAAKAAHVVSAAPSIAAGNAHSCQIAQFHAGRPILGFEEFFELKRPNEIPAAGRSWRAPELRRKSFEDLHKLWYVLYKERNLLLSEKAKRNRLQRPAGPTDEVRYACVKRSMGAIKLVLAERKKIYKIIEAETAAEIEAAAATAGLSEGGTTEGQRKGGEGKE